MKMTQPTTRHLRFDVDKSLLQQVKINYSDQIDSRTEYGKDDNHEWIGIRWNINLIDIPTGHEIVGQLSETRTFFERENKEKDFNDLKEFIQNSFMNCQMHFQDNAPSNFSTKSFTLLDFNKIANDFIRLIYNVE